MKYIEVRTDLSKKLSALSALGSRRIRTAVWRNAERAGRSARSGSCMGFSQSQYTAQAYSISGVVTSNSGSGFVMRTDDGRTMRVETNYEPSNLTAGDRVTVNGRFSGGTYIANSVRIVRDRDNDWNDRDNDWNDRGDVWTGRNVEGRRVVATGVVTRDLPSENAFDIRTDSGLPVRVRTRANEPRRLSVGDRVEVSGFAGRGHLRADTVRLLDDRSDNGNLRSFRGTVVRTTPGRLDFDVRLDDGRTVMVQGHRAADQAPLRRITRGDRVLIQGRLTRGGRELMADTIRITRDDDRGDNGSRISFPATVISVDSATRLQVRGDNGRTYVIDTRSVVSSNVDPGDRVRVSGVVRNGIVRADRVELTNRGTNRNPNGRGRIDFSATVVDGGSLWGGNILNVRGDNGRTYSVSVPRNSQSNFRRGDRVRIVGTQLENNRIQATSVTLQ
jgi:outer membrane lipoprotein SlyB